MRHSTFSALSIVLAANAVLAAPSTPATNPATPPAIVASPAEGGTILVFPLTDSSGGNTPWVGKAVQQDLVAELSRTTRAHVQAAGAPAPDAEAAVKAGRQGGATLVVQGQFQAVGAQMRFTGQVLDVASGRATGGFTATGQATDLFPLEDTVTGQVLRALPAGWLTVALPPENANPTGQGNEAPTSTPQQPPPAPEATSAQPPEYYSYTYPDYSGAPAVAYQNYWGYPYYWYAYPYYGPDLFFFYGYDRYHHFWGHGGYGGYGHYYGGFRGGDGYYRGGYGRGYGGFSAHPAFSGHGGGGGGGGSGGGSHGGGGGGGHGR